MNTDNGKEIPDQPASKTEHKWSSIESLKTIELFCSFPESVLQQLSEDCRIIHLQDEEVLFEEGAEPTKMWGLLTGQLLVYKLRKMIDLLKPGCVLGEMSLIDQEPRSASIRSIGQSTLVEISEDFFHNKVLTNSKASFSLLRTLSQRTRNNMHNVATECRHLHCLVHDLRNNLYPLSITEMKMEQIIQCLLGTQDWHKKREGAEDLDTGLRKMLSTKNNVLTLIDQTLSVTVRKKSEYIRKHENLAQLMQVTVDDLRYHRSVRDKKLTWNTSQIEDEMPLLNYLDIKRVLQNLIINAGYACEPENEVTIRGEKQNGHIQVSVTDQGSGIPDDVKPLLIKEKFSTRPDGNGYGLLTCREIIEDYHMGRFWFESQWGKGTTFYFTLPTNA